MNELSFTPSITCNNITYYFDDNGNEFWVDQEGKRHYTREEG